MTTRWIVAPPQPLLTARLAADLRVSPLLAQCLVNRGLADEQAESSSDRAAAFLDPRLKQLADPFLIPNMAAAVERLRRARARAEPLVIFGDYDVDGVTSAALLLEVFARLGLRADAYLPHRLDEGYGLTQEAVENCLHRFPRPLLLAVDCGSTARETIAWLRARGVDVIVLDHHQVSVPPPDATALVNPQLALCASPGEADSGHSASATASAGARFTELCSVGLAFKLAHALVKSGREAGEPAALDFDLKPLLDLVALGTIADLVPLTGENRVLAAAGLERLNATQRPGLRALREVAQISGAIGVYEVGFQLAPRLNAAGRLENAEHALELLRATDLATAAPLARDLDAQNRERQHIERGIVEEVIGAVRAKFDPTRDYVIVEGQLLWHIGVVGIVASRVMREFHRPTLIIGGDGAEWRGSGRSIEGFDLAAALRDCGDLLLRHGGHAMAAGVTVHCDNLDALRTRLNELGRRALSLDQLRPRLRLDAEVRLAQLTLERLAEFDRLAPIGQGNPAVQLAARGLRHHRPPQSLGKEKQHLKLWVTDGSATHEAVWWNCASRPPIVEPFDLAFAPLLNEFNGRRLVQLKVLDWRPAS